MKKIMLACCAGMSTSLLVSRMQKEAEKRGLDCKIWAISETELPNEYATNPCDVILVGPQIRFAIPTIKKQVNDAIPVDVIDMRTYGMMDGGKTLDQALKMLENWKK